MPERTHASEEATITELYGDLDRCDRQLQSRSSTMKIEVNFNLQICPFHTNISTVAKSWNDDVLHEGPYLDTASFDGKWPFPCVNSTSPAWSARPYLAFSKDRMKGLSLLLLQVYLPTTAVFVFFVALLLHPYSAQPGMREHGVIGGSEKGLLSVLPSLFTFIFRLYGCNNTVVSTLRV